MNIYWFIYILGFGAALFYVTHDFMEWCKKNNKDYKKGLNDIDVIADFIICAIGSWVTVLFLYMTKEDD
jgi:hypothetical protein